MSAQENDSSRESSDARPRARPDGRRSDGWLIDIEALTNRFLGWPVPATECADGCASMHGYQYPRSGTNFLSADGARQMLEYVLSARPAEGTLGAALDWYGTLPKAARDALSLSDLHRLAKRLRSLPVESGAISPSEASASTTVRSAPPNTGGASAMTDKAALETPVIGTTPATVEALIHRAEAAEAMIALFAHRLETAEQARSEAARLMSHYAREAGEATGRLEMSEAAGIVDGWRERAEAAEGVLAQADIAVEAAEDRALKAEAKVAKYRERLEVDHCYRVEDGEMVRVELAEDDFPDGIECRDETIRLQDEANKRLLVRIKTAEATITRLQAELACAVEALKAVLALPLIAGSADEDLGPEWKAARAAVAKAEGR